MKPSNFAPFNSAALSRCLDFEPGEIIVTCGADAGQNLRESLLHAAMIRQMCDVDTIIYINLPFGAKKFTTTVQECYPAADRDPVFQRVTYPTGELYKYKYEIEAALEPARKAVLFVNAWEFAAKGYRQREELVFMLNSLRHRFNVTIFVYSHKDGRGAKPGMQHYGGLAKLAVMADKIHALKMEEQAQEAEQTAVEALPVETLLREVQKLVRGESAQLVSNKFNDLATHVAGSEVPELVISN